MLPTRAALRVWRRDFESWKRYAPSFMVSALGGPIFYLVAIGLSAFAGIRVGMLHEGTPLGIAFSLFVITVAALNLVLDFDFIEQGVEHGAPKHMEWYAAFGLVVTLIWLYVAILRLLSKLRSR